MIKGTIGIARADHMVIPWHFAHCLIKLIRHCDKVFGPGAVQLVITESSLLEENRTGIINLAQGEWLIMLDTDMTFPEDLAEKFDKHIKEGRDFVTGIYNMAYKDCPPAIYKPTDMNAIPERYYDYPDGVFEIGGCGFGGCVISKRLMDKFRTLSAFSRIIKLGKKLGEDLSFCYKAREKGFTLYADASLQLGHLRPYALSNEQGEAKIKHA